MEILELCKSLFVEDIDDYFENQEEKPKKELSEFNMYKKINNKTYFQDNFIKIMLKKFIEIYNYLNDENIQLNEKEENQEIQDNQDNQENKENQENQENQENKDAQENQENKENKDNKNYFVNGDKPLVLIFIEDRLPKLKKIINDSSKKYLKNFLKLNFKII